MKICLHDTGHMTKLAAMPIYGISPLEIFCGKSGAISRKFGKWHQGLLPSIVCSNDDPELTLTYFTARLNFVTEAFL